MRTIFDLEKKKLKIKELEREIQKPDFWENKKEAVRKNKEYSQFLGEVTEFEFLKEDFSKLDNEKDLRVFEKKLKEKEFQVFFLGKYDKGNAILSIYAGAGGRDSQDWATMLLRMYERHCSLKNLKTVILDQSFGEAGGPEGRIGIKSVTIEVKGKYAYGFLKKETGVHRLVRISPFSPNALRHTSFALVEVLPEISQDDSEIRVNIADLKIETFRASGPGGQYVNKRESAVRITHLPTGIVVASQAERLQGSNKDSAMKMLYAKLYQLKEKEHQKKVKEIKGKAVSASWGNQIRSYVLHPYKLVKDLRTNIETSSVEEVLDGNLDIFIEAETKI